MPSRSWNNDDVEGKLKKQTSHLVLEMPTKCQGGAPAVLVDAGAGGGLDCALLVGLDSSRGTVRGATLSPYLLHARL